MSPRKKTDDKLTPADKLDILLQDREKIVSVLQNMDARIKSLEDNALAGDHKNGELGEGEVAQAINYALHPDDERLAEFSDIPDVMVIPIAWDMAKTDFLNALKMNPLGSPPITDFFFLRFFRLRRGRGRQLLRETVLMAQSQQVPRTTGFDVTGES